MSVVSFALAVVFIITLIICEAASWKSNGFYLVQTTETMLLVSGKKRLHEKVYFFGRHKIQRHESVSVDCSGGGPIYYHGRVAKRVSFHRMMKNSKACIVFFNLIFEERKKHLDLLSKFLLILVFRFNAMFC